MLSCQKEKFNLPDGITFLNCAYMGPTPIAVEEAGIEALRKKSKPWEIKGSHFFEPGKKTRSLFAQLINAEHPDRIAVVSSVSHGMASVVKNLDAKKGQNVVMLEEQFPSNYYSWKRLSDEKGIELRIISPPDTNLNRGEKWNELLLNSIDEQTLAVALPHVHWADGTLFDLVSIGSACRKNGARLIIDGTQSVGAMPFDVQAIRPDALICGAYKWLFGPYVSGLAYFGESFDGGVPIEENWINRLGSDNFQNLVNYQSEYEPMSQRYNMGQRSQFVALAMLNKSLEMILDWTTEGIQDYCEKISADTLQRLAEAGLWLENDDQRGRHLIGIRLPDGVELERLKEKAIEQNISLSYRGNAIRVSPHVYNNENDFERLEKLILSTI